MKSLIGIRAGWSLLLITCLANPVFTQSTMRDSLILEYLFESPLPTLAVDSSGMGLDGTLLGTTPVKKPGYRGDGLEFNDKDVHILAGNTEEALDMQQFTIMAWVKPYSRGSDPQRIEIAEKTNTYWLNIREETGLFRVGCFFVPRGENTGEKWYYMDGDIPVPLNTWSHLAFSYDGVSMYSFINGRLVNSYPVDLDVRETDYDLSIGSRPPRNESGDTEPAAFFDGMMDEVRIFRRVLSTQEILRLMNLHNLPAAPPLAPSSLTITGSEPGRILLQWEDHSDNETEFRVESSYDEINWKPAGWTVTDSVRFSYTEATPGQTVFIRVCSAGITGQSGYSNIVSTVVPQETEPVPESIYSFENNVDDRFGSRHGLFNDQVAYTKGVRGQAMNCNGKDSYASIPYNLYEDFSVTLWIKTTEPGTSHRNKDWFRGSGLLDGNVGGYCGEFGVTLFDRYPAFGTGALNSHTTLLAGTGVTDGKWHHLAATFDNLSGTMRLFVDGMQEATTGNGKTGPKNAAGRLAIGSLQRDTNYFKGIIDEMHLYSYVLSQNDIQGIIESDTLSVHTGRTLAIPTGKLRVFPNPASHYIIMEGMDFCSIGIFDVHGKTVLEESLSPGERLDIGRLPAGMYFIRVSDRNHPTRVTRFIKQ